MGVEIERKFLVDAHRWGGREGEKHLIEQGYILNATEKNIRIRIYDSKGFITIKGVQKGVSRPEFEYEIPLDDARELIKGFCSSVVKKIRHKVLVGENVWEVDEFLEENRGLLMAEIELKNDDEAFQLPDWLGKEVTMDKRYYSSYLSRHPFTSWKDDGAV